jgi:hypothetical protein
LADVWLAFAAPALAPSSSSAHFFLENLLFTTALKLGEILLISGPIW